MTDHPDWATSPGLPELRLLRLELDGIGKPEATLALLLLLTMQAPADVALMDWRDVDLVAGTWILPGCPRRTALLSSAAIGQLIVRSRGGVRSAGVVIHDGEGRPLLDQAANGRRLREMLPTTHPVAWTMEGLHRTATDEWRQQDVDALGLIGRYDSADSDAEQTRLRRAVRFALDDWARLLQV